MRQLLRVIALSLPIAGAGLSWAYLRSFSSGEAKSIDLTIAALRLDVRPDRRIEIALTVANRGTGTTPTSRLFVHSVVVEHEITLAPLRPGEERAWFWVSPPLAPGDYELVAGVEHRGRTPDADESNNLARSLVHVASPNTTGVDGPSSRMPSVVGLDRRSAIRALRAAGFVEPLWYERARGPAIDRVNLQWPDPGTRMSRATHPVLVAAAERSVPDLQRLRLEQARDRLNEMGLVAGPLRIERSVHYEDRSVLDQEPKPGSRIVAASPVRLVVSEPQPLWPFVIGGLMCVLSVVLALSTRVWGARAAAPGNLAWATPMRASWPIARPVAPVPVMAGARGADRQDLEVDSAADSSLAVLVEPGEALDVRGDVATIDPPVIPAALEEERTTALDLPAHVPERRTVVARPVASITFGELQFIPVRGDDCQDVTWQSERTTTTIVFLIIRDPGDRRITWYPHGRSTT